MFSNARDHKHALAYPEGASARDPSHESSYTSHSTKHKKRGSTHRQKDASLLNTTHQTDSAVFAHANSSRGQNEHHSRELLNQTQTYIPSSQLIRGSSKDIAHSTRNS